jgi:asparaginyl-tRNA synthetase
VYGGNAEGTEIGGMLYPMSKKEHTMEHMREHAHLRSRGRIHAAAMRVRHAMAYATHNFFHNHGFLYIQTPIITAADAEGAGEQFAVTTLLGSDHLKPHVTLPVHEPPPVRTVVAFLTFVHSRHLLLTLSFVITRSPTSRTQKRSFQKRK